MSLSESERFRRLFDEQIRRGSVSQSEKSDDLNPVVATERVVRWLARDDVGWSEISGSHVDEHNVDGVITAQMEHFAAAGQSFVWTVYDSDLPGDLGSRLIRGGVHSFGNI